MTESETPASPGPGVDREGRPVIDPTKNVLNLVEASVRRLDDLRRQSEKYIVDMATMAAAHAKELRELEAQRIDAIRTVDVAASQQTAKDAEVRAAALAKQVTDAAEAMRAQVAQTASAAATSLGAALVPIQERLAELTRLQYEQQGQKQQVVESRASDADFAPILTAIARLETIASEARGQKTQVIETQAKGVSVGMWVAVGISALVALIALVALLLTLSRSSTPAAAPFPSVTVTTPTGGTP